MSPILIESKDIFKYGFAAVLLALTLFFSGVFYGYNKAEIHHNNPVVSASLGLPEVAETAVAEREPLTPEVLAPGSDRDVDEVASEEIAESSELVASSASQADTSAPAEPVAKDTSPAVEADTPEEEAVLAVGGPVEPAADDPLTLMKDTAEAQAARYTIQVGLFSTETNAERRVEELQALELNAWSSVFTNKKQQQRYNVRFGYFDSYRDAKQALQAFKDTHKGEGYLVSLKR